MKSPQMNTDGQMDRWTQMRNGKAVVYQVTDLSVFIGVYLWRKVLAVHGVILFRAWWAVAFTSGSGSAVPSRMVAAASGLLGYSASNVYASLRSGAPMLLDSLISAMIASRSYWSGGMGAGRRATD